MVRVLAVLTVVMLAGCGGGDCKARSGTYTQKLTARSGNCGGPIESVVVMPSQPTQLPAGCTGTLTASTDNCDVTMDTTCAAPQNQTLKMAGKAEWSVDAVSGTAILSMEIRDASSGSFVCQGSYDAKWTKL